MAESQQEKPQNVFNFNYTRDSKDRPPQEYYDAIKERFAHERDVRLGYRPPGTDIYQEMGGVLGDYEVDPYAEESIERDPIVDEVEVLLF